VHFHFEGRGETRGGRFGDLAEGEILRGRGAGGYVAYGGGEGFEPAGRGAGDFGGLEGRGVEGVDGGIEAVGDGIVAVLAAG
jgi:hypothetical protein